MDLSKQVSRSPNACKINLYYDATLIPSTSESLGKFYSSTLTNGDENQTYISSGSISVRETAKSSSPGVPFKQTISFKFPSTDELRAQRIAQFKKVKFLTIELTNGAKLLFGRNDVKQNTPPKIKISSNEKTTQIQFEQLSIAPLGFVIQSNFLYQDEILFVFQDEIPFNT